MLILLLSSCASVTSTSAICERTEDARDELVAAAVTSTPDVQIAAANLIAKMDAGCKIP
jgi:hypothetical protein